MNVRQDARGTMTSALFARSLVDAMAEAKSVFEAPLEGVTIAKGVAQDLADQLGDRLVRVLLYGSWARGEARPDSDVDILVVVSKLGADDRRYGGSLSDLAADWFERGGRVVTIRAVTESEIREAAAARLPTVRDMFLRTAAAEAKTILDAA
jgi:predicted nucleotidyltransferase